MNVKKVPANVAVEELTLLLMYLTRFNEKDRFYTYENKSWKGYDFEIIDGLDEKEYIHQGSHRAKSIIITEEGIKKSKELLEKYQILDWEK